MEYLYNKEYKVFSPRNYKNVKFIVNPYESYRDIEETFLLDQPSLEK